MGDDCEGSVNPNEVMSVSEGVLAGWWPKPRRHGIGWIIPYLFNSPQWGSCSTMARIWQSMACLKDSGLVYSKPHKNKKAQAVLSYTAMLSAGGGVCTCSYVGLQSSLSFCSG